MRVLVTGASGFVAGVVVPVLEGAGHSVRAAIRSAEGAGPRAWAVGNLGSETDWTEAVRGLDAVVHLAGRTHVMRDEAREPLAEYRRVNVEGSKRLAEQAAAAGVGRLVFVSTIKVNGEETTGRTAYRADHCPAPVDAYGISKWEAEQALWRVADESGLEVVVIRPPLVYGPGLKGNLLKLMELIDKGRLLPLGAASNRRSIVSVHNLSDLLVRCLEVPEAAGRTFLVSDAQALSTAELARRLGRALGRRARLVPVPPRAARMLLAATGRAALGQRLFGSLEVDTEATERILGWTPRQTVDEGLEETARWYLERGRPGT